MPQPTQTPARQRFRQGPQHQPQKDQHGSSVQAYRFTGLSQVSSSPFPRTPFTSHIKSTASDEIDTNDGDDVESSPFTGHSTKRPQPEQTVETIHDDSQESQQAVDESIVEVEAESIISDQARNHDYRPSSAHKRRRVSHSLTASHHRGSDLMLLSAEDGREVPSKPQLEDSATEPNDERQMSEDEGTSSPDASIVTPQKSSRFRMVNPSTTIQATSRSSYQAALSSAYRGPYPVLDVTLPDAFSPSKRKGVQEYIHGGLAATVRRWVLELAAEESRLQHKEEARNTIRVVKAFKDPNGRFVAVEDESLKVWLLVAEQQTRTSRPRSASEFDCVEAGAQVCIKGSEGSSWDLPMSIAGLGNEGAASQSCRVAVLWHVVK